MAVQISPDVTFGRIRILDEENDSASCRCGVVTLHFSQLGIEITKHGRTHIFVNWEEVDTVRGYFEKFK